jgi:hypothetical protein
VLQLTIAGFLSFFVFYPTPVVVLQPDFIGYENVFALFPKIRAFDVGM